MSSRLRSGAIHREISTMIDEPQITKSRSLLTHLHSCEHRMRMTMLRAMVSTARLSLVAAGILAAALAAGCSDHQSPSLEPGDAGPSKDGARAEGGSQDE